MCYFRELTGDMSYSMKINNGRAQKYQNSCPDFHKTRNLQFYFYNCDS